MNHGGSPPRTPPRSRFPDAGRNERGQPLRHSGCKRRAGSERLCVSLTSGWDRCVAFAFGIAENALCVLFGGRDMKNAPAGEPENSQCEPWGGVSSFCAKKELQSDNLYLHLPHYFLIFLGCFKQNIVVGAGGGILCSAALFGFLIE